MPQHTHTTTAGKHVYSYTEAELADAIKTAFDWAQIPGNLEKLSALRERDALRAFSLRAASVLDDAADCSELWDTSDFDYAFTQEVQ